MTIRPEVAAAGGEGGGVDRLDGVAVDHPGVDALLVQALPEGTRGTALAIRLTRNRFGQVATPAAAGLVAGAAGASAAFWRFGGLLGLAALTVNGRPPTAAASPHRVLDPATGDLNVPARGEGYGVGVWAGGRAGPA